MDELQRDPKEQLNDQVEENVVEGVVNKHVREEAIECFPLSRVVVHVLKYWAKFVRLE